MAAFDLSSDLREKFEEDTVAVSFTGFPVRSLTRNVGGKVGGEWVLAYQMQQKERLKLTVASAINGYTSSSGTSDRLTAPENTPAATSAHQRLIFDQKFLLKKGYVDNPTNLCIIDVSGSNLNYYKENGFEEFDNLDCVVASDNQLPLEAFTSFPVLQELELSLNGIVNVQVSIETFTSLKKLNLSYNQINDTSITSLGLLPQLEELHLTGNSIATLPIDMSRPHRLTPKDSNAESSMRISFPRLERFWLDDNRLTDPTTFAILAGLRRLKYLNLDNNELISIPHLKLLGSGMLQEPLPQSPSDNDNVVTNNRSDMTSLSLAPFPQLQTLSLCNNMMLNSSNLLPCGVWPVLKELIIIGNPIVSMQRGLSSVLHDELVMKCNINIIRNEQNGNNKVRIGKKAMEFMKVSVSPPPLIPKRPIVLAIESAPLTDDSTLSNDSFSDITSNGTISTTPTQSQHSHRKKEDDISNNTTAAGVFLTEFDQGNEHDDSQMNNDHDINNTNQDSSPPLQDAQEILPLQEEAVMSAKEMFAMKLKTDRETFSKVAEKYKGYESLLNEEDDCYDESPPIPNDQHSCAQVLKYALDHQLSIKRREHSPHLITTSKTGQYLKKTSIGSQQYHTVPAVSSRTKEVNSIIKDLKSHQMSWETNLKDILNQQKSMKTPLHQDLHQDEGVTPSARQQPTTTSPATKDEGKKLFTELQVKYNKVRELSLSTLAVIDSTHQIAKTAS